MELAPLFQMTLHQINVGANVPVAHLGKLNHSPPKFLGVIIAKLELYPLVGVLEQNQPSGESRARAKVQKDQLFHGG